MRRAVMVVGLFLIVGCDEQIRVPHHPAPEPLIPVGIVPSVMDAGAPTSPPKWTDAGAQPAQPDFRAQREHIERRYYPPPSNLGEMKEILPDGGVRVSYY